MSVFIIAECGSNWRFGSGDYISKAGAVPNELMNAYRMIRAAKECGADAAKFQWVSDYRLLMSRRGADLSEEWAYKYVPFPQDWLPLLKAECDRVGIEFMVTAYLPADVAVIAPFVKRFKVAAKESQDFELLCQHSGHFLHGDYGEIIISQAHDSPLLVPTGPVKIKRLLCVSKYPTSLDELKLAAIKNVDGLSDHTAHVLTGAVAVGAGARIIESHVRLHDTPRECPDFPHSLPMNEGFEGIAGEDNSHLDESYNAYVQNIRTAERML